MSSNISKRIGVSRRVQCYFPSNTAISEIRRHINRNNFFKAFKCYKHIGVIRRVQCYFPSNTANLLVKAMVFPHFDYCSLGWSNFTTGHHHHHLQILQNKLARVLLHADIRTPIDKMMEELSWLKLDDRMETPTICNI